MRNYAEYERNLTAVKGMVTFEKAQDDSYIILLKTKGFNSDTGEYEIDTQLEGYRGVMKAENARKLNVKEGTVTSCLVDEIDNDNKIIYFNRERAYNSFVKSVINNLKENDVISAKIVNFTEKKVYVDLGCGYVVALPMKDLSYTIVEDIREFFRAITDIKVKVYIKEDGELGYSLKDALESGKSIVERYNIGDEILAYVEAIYNDGAKIRIRPNLVSKVFGNNNNIKVGDTIKVAVTGKVLSDNNENRGNFLNVEFKEKVDNIRFKNLMYYR